MPNSSSQEFIALANVKEPAQQTNDEHWASLESDLNLICPEDYKEVISAVGRGFFGRGLSIWTPSATSEGFLLSRQSLLSHKDLLKLALPRLNVPVYPDPGGGVVVASMDNYYLYLRNDDNTGVLNGLRILEMDFEELFVTDSSFPQFFLDLYRRRLDEPWAVELRDSIWSEDEYTFFHH
jgi:hypothetical protein